MNAGEPDRSWSQSRQIGWMARKCEGYRAHILRLERAYRRKTESLRKKEKDYELASDVVRFLRQNDISGALQAGMKLPDYIGRLRRESTQEERDKAKLNRALRRAEARRRQP